MGFTRNKKDERGVVVRNKARLVTQGHRQEEGIDYDEVFAPVARIKAIRIFLAFTSYMGFLVYQLDVKSAFLYGKIDVEDKYVVEILKKFDFASVKTASTPVETQKPLVKDEEAADVDVHLYRSMIGSLMYLTASRPDIMFAVCACSRFQVTLKTSHLNAMKRIFRYLKGKPKLGLWYLKVLSFDLEAYSDSDYAGANLDRKSTIGEDAHNEKRNENATPIATPTVFGDDETIAEFLAYINKIIVTLKPLPKSDPKDKGKKVLKEEAKSYAESEGVNETERKFAQLANDEYIASRRRNRDKFTIERGEINYFHDTIAAHRRFLAQQRASENRSEVFVSASDSSVNEIEEENNQVNDRFKKVEGYHAVPPPYTGNYMPSRPDLSFAELDDSFYKTDVSETITILTKSDNVLVNTAKQSSSRAAIPNSTARYVNTAASRPTMNGGKTCSNIFHKSHSSVKRTIYQRTVPKNSDFKEKVNTAKDQGIFDSGCSRHMTGNKSYLTDYQDIDGGFVAFAGSPK
ncbi:ribonuclease H-like domain, reverse transcriptase, RNA-dependent DNA polymerase [Tanacetum coccineum]